MIELVLRYDEMKREGMEKKSTVRSSANVAIEYAGKR